MVVEHAIRCANGSLAVLEWIPCQTNTRSYVIGVARNALRDSKRILGCRRDCVRCAKRWGELYVVASTVIECQIGLHAPRILEENTKRVVGEAVMRISHTLHETLRDAQTVGLHRRKAGDIAQSGNAAGEAQLRRRQRAKVVKTAEVHGEVCGERQMIHITAELHTVIAHAPGEVI